MKQMTGLDTLRQSEPEPGPEGSRPDEMEDAAEGEEVEDESNVSPEEQALYEQTVRNGLTIIYPKGEEAAVAPSVIDTLKSSDNPIVNLASAAVSIVTYLRDSAKEAGQPLPDEILYHAGVALCEELAEVAEAEKIFDYSEEQIEQAFYQALDMYRVSGEQTGDVDSEQLKAGFETIRQADAEGRLGEVLPGIEERMGDQG